MNKEDRDILEELIRYNKERISELEEYYKTINREMGEVCGELRWIKWLVMAIASGFVAQFIIWLIGGH